MVLKPGTGSFGTVCRCQVLLENEICISIKLVAAGSMKCSKTSWYTAVLTLDLRKHSGPTPGRWHGTPNHHWLWETLHWTSSNVDSVPLLSSSRLRVPWLPKEMQNLLSSENITLDHSAAVQSFLSLAQAETLLTLSVVQEWLDTRNATAETHVLHTSVRSGSWSTDSSCSPLFVNLPHIFEWVLFHNPLQGAVIPIACTLFYHIFSFPSPLY